MEAINKNEMKPLTKVVSDWVHEYFKQTDIKIFEDGNRATYEFTCSDKGDFNYNSYVEVYEETQTVMVYEYTPIMVSERKRQEVACLLTMSNFGLKTGRIEMNWDTGKIRFVAEIVLDGGLLSVEMINILVDRGMSILDHYLPAVMAVIHANTSAEDAYKELDNSDQSANENPQKTDVDDAWAWERFLGSDPIRGWANDLQLAVEEKADAARWNLIGRGAVLVNSDEHYCREILKRVAADSGMNFVHIPSYEVISISPAASFRSMAPVLIYLEPGRWMLSKGNDDESSEDTEIVDKFQSKLARWMREFNVNRPVVFAVSVNQLNDLSSELKQVGLFDRFMTLPRQSLDTIGADFVEQLGHDLCGTSMFESPGKIGRLISWHFDDLDQRELAILTLKRIHQRTNKPIEFIDLVHISTHDLLEEGIPQSIQEAIRLQTAYHEAGHAIMAVLETDGHDVPDYTSIVPGATGFAGVTVESYGFYYAKGDDQKTYKDFRCQIRVSLAGRAAEEILVGVENVSNGASGDLESATKSSWRAFAYWGFAPNMDKPECSGDNLAVVYGKPTDDEFGGIAQLTREFLATEYQVVRDKLLANKSLLDEVAERLMWDPIVDQGELADICKKHNVMVCV